MKYPTTREGAAAFEAAGEFSRPVTGGRIVIYSEHTDPMGRNVRHWLCFQFPNPWAHEKGSSAYTIAGQIYLEKDGCWRAPRGASFRRHFSTPAAAIKAANSATITAL